MNKIGALVEVIENTLEEQKKLCVRYANIKGLYQEYANIEGWIEALEYVLEEIEVMVE